MSTPTTKTIRISAETHARIVRLQDKLGDQTADGAIRFLLSMDAVRVNVTPEQRDRWQAAATAAGLRLSDFVHALTEAAIMYGTDRGTMQLMYQHVREIRGLVRAVHGIATAQSPTGPPVDSE